MLGKGWTSPCLKWDMYSNFLQITLEIDFKVILGKSTLIHDTAQPALK